MTDDLIIVRGDLARRLKEVIGDNPLQLRDFATEAIERHLEHTGMEPKEPHPDMFEDELTK